MMKLRQNNLEGKVCPTCGADFRGREEKVLAAFREKTGVAVFCLYTFSAGPECALRLEDVKLIFDKLIPEHYKGSVYVFDQYGEQIFYGGILSLKVLLREGGCL